ncbi:hypothetical protein CHS0354_031186 [Potamilus streckersoni]|uniref:Uncharacterized protein n=1 Tax=Potamilus streckersoni TaxID=2493646 RepID=A0AAE0TKW1_9BIVA|nr:hypothetical protein CHS0354_031186 [Potamilus streckersoni]
MTADLQRGRIYRDPFVVDPLPKAFYHPSPEKKLSKDKRKITISPERRVLKAPQKVKQGSPADEKFLQGTHHYQTKPSTEEDTSSSKFDESWPSSERQSSISINDGEDISPVGNRFQLASDRLADLQQHLGEKVPIPTTASVKIGTVDSQERKKSAEESIIQKYVERFRKGTPMSREERQKQKTEEEKDFWWLTQGKPPTPASSSTPKDDETSKRTRSFLSTFEDNKSRPFEVPPSPGEEKTRHLQEKADRLLEKSSSTLTSSGPIVSTVGLGSTGSDLSSFEEPAYRPGFAREADRGFPSRLEFNLPVYRDVPKTRPIDDILYQWRLKRKMEAAKESAPPTSRQFGFLSKTDQEKKIDEKLALFKQRLAGRNVSSDENERVPHVHFTPTPQQFHVSQPQSSYGLVTYKKTGVNERLPDSEQFHRRLPDPNQYDVPIASPFLKREEKLTSKEVDPHLHLMCDLLPCPHSNDFLRKSVEVHGFTDSEPPIEVSSNTEVKRTAHKDREYKMYLEAEKPDVEKEPEMSKVKKGKKAEGSNTKEIRRKKKEKDEDKIEDSSENFEEVNLEFSSSNKSKHRESSAISEERIKSKSNKMKGQNDKKAVPFPKHSSSPTKHPMIQDTIGQVVKDRLFNLSESSVVFSSVESLPSSHMSPVQQPQHPQKQKQQNDTIGRMNAEPAEKDEEYVSEGEFSDDQLLQMLRQKRAQYEQQLQEIDGALSQLMS